MDKLVRLICMYAERDLLSVINPKPNTNAYADFGLLAKFAYDNRTEQTCSTALLRELLKCKLNPSAHRGFWRKFDALVGDAFNTILSTSIKRVLDAPIKYGFDV